ncbi:hypothetical protein [Rhodococcoides fascians]|uniref:hypothetical protein n=1 Tax=Rhodococcoides fascians TaxID=1828 RepID=UPI00056533FB|nr:hypothetical protein [Rhodococcus fascians]
MGSPGEPITHWQALALAADRNQLYLNPEAAQACHSACDEYILKLKTHQETARMLADVRGLGNFDMGLQLQQVFANKAVGGANNMVDVLQSHIDVVEEMKVVFAKFFVATQDVDDDNAAGLIAEGPN